VDLQPQTGDGVRHARPADDDMQSAPLEQPHVPLQAVPFRLCAQSLLLKHPHVPELQAVPMEFPVQS